MADYIPRWRLTMVQPGGLVMMDCASFEDAENHLGIIVQRGGQVTAFQITKRTRIRTDPMDSAFCTCVLQTRRGMSSIEALTVENGHHVELQCGPDIRINLTTSEATWLVSRLTSALSTRPPEAKDAE